MGHASPLLLAIAATTCLAALTSPLAAHPTPPGAPCDLVAAPAGTNLIKFEWRDTSKNETGFLLESRMLGGSFEPIRTLKANVKKTTVSGLQEGTYYQFRLRAFNPAGNSPFTNVVGAYTDQTGSPGTCFPTLNNLCLGPQRFRVSVDFLNGSTTQPAQLQEIRPDAGVFWFFNQDNLDGIIEVINACGSTPPRYWIFAAGLTNVQHIITVTDTQAGSTRRYFNPQGKPFAPIQDTSAFATCP